VEGHHRPYGRVPSTAHRHGRHWDSFSVGFVPFRLMLGILVPETICFIEQCNKSNNNGVYEFFNKISNRKENVVQCIL
jgi:hypothetical protein